LNARLNRFIARMFWRQIREGAAEIVKVDTQDLEAAWAIGEAFPDQGFSIVDCTSFAVMERLGIRRAASFDNHFAVYRFGRNREQAFDILR
jgi:predicted nucleic acid-binding protein